MNALNKNLKGKTVWVKKNGELRAFICESGFGCSPNTNGRKIFGKWEAMTINGRPCGKEEMIYGHEVESIYR